MSKLDYGGFSVEENNDPLEYPDGWAKLKTIAEYLQDAEPIPPYLARWLGEAILNAKGNSTELLLLLEVGNTRGRQNTFHKDAWFFYGEQIEKRMQEGLIFNKAIEELELIPGEEKLPSYGTLHNFHQKYLRAIEETDRISLEEGSPQTKRSKHRQ